MILQSTIENVIELQKVKNIHQTNLKRDALKRLPEITSHALIISGVRRCGKSTLMSQLREQQLQQSLYLNFDDARLYGFDFDDFARIDKIILSQDVKILYFDEIQIIAGWERYVRQKLDENFRLIISGSNATLLSKELGTHLTGRHITKELYPFSYNEFVRFKFADFSKESVSQYLLTGGFPEYIKSGDDDILLTLLEDILIRDIAVRYNLRDVKMLQRLVTYLMSNVGKTVSGNKTGHLTGIHATSTVLEYFSHLENSWLFMFMPKFSYSVKAQLINPRKVYAIDTGLVNVSSISFSPDLGRKFENMIFLYLKRSYKEIYYFAEKAECDFVIFDKGQIHSLIQVCYELNQDNLVRELNGLYEAMDFFNLSNGTIVTLNQQDGFSRDNKTISVVRAFDFLVI
jgi:predicted AAA+ superfamily ATPase